MIPECNITLDNVLAMYRENPDGKIDFEKASWRLGSYDKRTLARHYRQIEEILAKTNIALAEYGSAISSFAALPPPEPAHDCCVLFESHVHMLNDAGIAMRGESQEIEPIVIVAKTYFEQRVRIPTYCPLNLVSYLIHFHDTS